MSKRKLTKQQQRRIKSNLATITDNIHHSDLLSGIVVAHHGLHVEIMQPDKSIVHGKKRQNLGEVVVGDKVWWKFIGNDQSAGIVAAIHRRRSILHKFSKQGKKTPLAANVDQMLIVISPTPCPGKTTIDRYLIAAERDGITPIIVLNKIDLLNTKLDTLGNSLSNLLNIYKKLGYLVVMLQAKVKDNYTGDLTTLKSILKNKSSVIVGQSGVGKSSLIKALLPNSLIITGELAENIAQGKHTTTTSRLYELPFGGCIIDSPGVRSFQVDNLVSQDLMHGFAEIQAFIGLCKYKNCIHSGTDLGCAIQDAILNNKISRERFESYCVIRDGKSY